MRRVILFFTSILFVSFCFAQNEQDSLLTLLNKAKADTVRVNILNQLSANSFNTSTQQAIKYGNDARRLAEDISYIRGVAYALKNIGIAYYMQADYVQTLTYWNQSLQEFEKLNDKTGMANIYSNLGAVYFNQGDDIRALDYYLKALKFAEETNDTLRLVTVLNNIGTVYLNKTATHDKALAYYLRALPLSEALGDNEAVGVVTVNIGEIYLKKNEDSLALQYFEKSIKVYDSNSTNITYSLNDIAKVYEYRKDYATALKYHDQAFEIAKKLSAKLEMSQSLEGLAFVYSRIKQTSKSIDTYKQAESFAKTIAANYELEKIYKGLADNYATTGDYSNAYKYQLLLTTVKDTLYDAEADKKLASLQLSFEIQQKQAEIDLLTRDKALKELDLKTQAMVRNSLIAVLSLVMLIAFILFRNYRIKDKTNALLDAQKKEVEKALSDLKATQSQLIHSEKMASLGELTAGIAHEIQNPLNFVNNFSELNSELISEMLGEVDNGNIEEVKSIAGDIKRNLDKINHHGKRADAIVKGMLLHSSSSIKYREPTNINALANEYLRLSFHGLKAKDRSFNTTTQTYFDPKVDKISIVPQDVGRVLLNLINNAFYAVNEKKKNADDTYQPVVSVSTKRITVSGRDGVEIIVKDNGTGIPHKLLDKIFQPFFSTKPTGQGTGLGLSMAYDIITKEHKGTIQVKSTEGEGSEFIIQLFY